MSILGESGSNANSDSSGQEEYMSIPAGWLCYLAPELIRELRVVMPPSRSSTGGVAAAASRARSASTSRSGSTSGGGLSNGGGEDLPFTRASDVYAFGTVWYELLTGEWPWKQQPPEAIIWQAGRGIKPSLANLQVRREFLLFA